MAVSSFDPKRSLDSSGEHVDLSATNTPSIDRAAFLAAERGQGAESRTEDIRALLLKAVSSAPARDDLTEKGREGALALARLMVDKETPAGARIVAAELLGGMGYRETIPALEQVVRGNEYPDALRLKALEALGKFALDAGGSVSTLKSVLLDPTADKEERKAAAKSLGETHHRDAIEPLSSIATNEREDPELRSKAIKALEKIGSRLASPALLQIARSSSNPELRTDALDALATLGEREALPDFMNAVENRSENPGRRVELINALGKMGGEAEPLLKEIMLDKGEDLEARVAAYGSLISISAVSGPEKIKELLPLARDLYKNPEVPEEIRDLSFGVIANLDEEMGKKLIVGALQDKDASVKIRHACLEGVKALKLVEAESTLIDIITSKDEEVYFKAGAAEALGALKTEKGNNLLVTLVKDPETDPVLANGALKALVEQKDPRVKEILLERLNDRKGGSLTAPAFLVELDERRAIPHLIETVKDENRSSMERKAAIEALAAFGDPSALPAIQAVGKDGDPYLGVTVRDALVRLGDAAASDVLQQDLSDPKKAAEAIEPLAQSLNPRGAISVMRALEGAHKGDFKEISMNLSEGVKASGGVPAFAERLRKGAEVLQGEEREKVLQYAGALEKASALGIESPFRFTPSGLTTLVQNRLEDKRDDRPLAVLVYPREDHNGVFSDTATEVDKLIKGGYRVMLYEVDNDKDAALALKSGTHIGEGEKEQRASVVVLGGHGDRGTISFGAGDPAAGVIEDKTKTFDLEDLKLLQGVSRSLEDGGSIVLISCSNGEGKAGAENIANLMRQAFPQAGAGRIFSAAEPTRPVELILDGNGRLQDVRFSGDEYRASAGSSKVTA